MTDSALYLERSGSRADLVLNRPAKRNAITAEMWRTLPDLVKDAAADDRIKVLVVRGTGGAFASGADIGEFETVYGSPETADAYTASIAVALDQLALFPKPTIAMIRGACIGGGCGLALSCDLRFASAGSRFGITPAKLGLTYTLNDTKRLIEAVGVANAKDILFSGRHLDADEALEMGLINRCLPDDELEKEVDAYIDTLNQRSTVSARLSKRIIALIGAGIDQDTEETRKMFFDAFQSDDFREGYRAFLEKRDPDFSGGEQS